MLGFDRRVGECPNSSKGFAGLADAAKLAQECAADPVVVEIGLRRPRERLRHGKRRLWSTPLNHGHRTVRRHDWGRRVLFQGLTELLDLGLVSLSQGARACARTGMAACIRIKAWWSSAWPASMLIAAKNSGSVGADAVLIQVSNWGRP